MGPIFSPMIGSLIQREYQVFRQSLSSEQKEWMQHLGDGEKSEWIDIISKDENIQEKMKQESECWIFGESTLSPEEKKMLPSWTQMKKKKPLVQRPFSSAYL